MSSVLAKKINHLFLYLRIKYLENNYNQNKMRFGMMCVCNYTTNRLGQDLYSNRLNNLVTSQVNDLPSLNYYSWWVA